jgi:hypothetical protein
MLTPEPKMQFHRRKLRMAFTALCAFGSLISANMNAIPSPDPYKCIDVVPQEMDRLQKQGQALRLQKDEAERKADYELSAASSRAAVQVTKCCRIADHCTHPLMLCGLLPVISPSFLFAPHAMLFFWPILEDASTPLQCPNYEIHRLDKICTLPTFTLLIRMFLVCFTTEYG